MKIKIPYEYEHILIMCKFCKMKFILTGIVGGNVMEAGKVNYCPYCGKKQERD